MRIIGGWICILLFVSVTFSQSNNKIMTDPKNQKPMLVGKCTRAGLNKGSFREWFQKEYKDYKPDTATLALLKNQWKDIRITVVLGTWCGDSRREVPRLFRILDEVRFKRRNIKLICLDRDKKADGMDVSSLQVQYVPTIIVYRGKAEMGRIIESPRETLEKDLYLMVGLAEKK